MWKISEQKHVRDNKPYPKNGRKVINGSQRNCGNGKKKVLWSWTM